MESRVALSRLIWHDIFTSCRPRAVISSIYTRTPWVYPPAVRFKMLHKKGSEFLRIKVNICHRWEDWVIYPRYFILHSYHYHAAMAYCIYIYIHTMLGPAVGFLSI